MCLHFTSGSGQLFALLGAERDGRVGWKFRCTRSRAGCSRVRMGWCCAGLDADQQQREPQNARLAPCRNLPRRLTVSRSPPCRYLLTKEMAGSPQDAPEDRGGHWRGWDRRGTGAVSAGGWFDVGTVESAPTFGVWRSPKRTSLRAMAGNPPSTELGQGRDAHQQGGALGCRLADPRKANRKEASH